MIATLATAVVFVAITLMVSAVKWTDDPNTLAIEELRYRCRDCEKAEQLAYQHFDQKQRRIIFWGLPEEGMTTTELMPLLAERFNIQSLLGGCVRNPNIECYNQKMKELLVAEFGREALDRAYLEANQRYDLKKANQ